MGTQTLQRPASLCKVQLQDYHISSFSQPHPPPWPAKWYKALGWKVRTPLSLWSHQVLHNRTHFLVYTGIHCNVFPYMTRPTHLLLAGRAMWRQLNCPVQWSSETTVQGHEIKKQRDPCHVIHWCENNRLVIKPSWSRHRHTILNMSHSKSVQPLLQRFDISQTIFTSRNPKMSPNF